MAKLKSRHKQFVDKNPIESVRDLGTGVVQSVATDVVKGMTSDLFKQFLGLSSSEQKPHTNKMEGDLSEGEEVVFNNAKKQAGKTEIEAGEVAIQYQREIVKGESLTSQKEVQTNVRSIQEIKMELKQLISSIKELKIQFKEVTVEQRIEKPGKYHQTFFEWLLSTIRTARMKVEDSAVWLSVFKSKKAKRDYWSMAKEDQGGTSFSLSNERVVATQVG